MNMVFKILLGDDRYWLTKTKRQKVQNNAQ